MKAVSDNRIHVYFMPGLAASPDIFQYIELPADQFEIHLLDWILPEPEMDLVTYAKKVASNIRHRSLMRSKDLDWESNNLAEDKLAEEQLKNSIVHNRNAEREVLASNWKRAAEVRRLRFALNNPSTFQTRNRTNTVQRRRVRRH